MKRSLTSVSTAVDGSIWIVPEIVKAPVFTSTVTSTSAAPCSPLVVGNRQPGCVGARIGVDVLGDEPHGTCTVAEGPFVAHDLAIVGRSGGIESDVQRGGTGNGCGEEARRWTRIGRWWRRWWGIPVAIVTTAAATAGGEGDKAHSHSEKLQAGHCSAGHPRSAIGRHPDASFLLLFEGVLEGTFETLTTMAVICLESTTVHQWPECRARVNEP